MFLKISKVSYLPLLQKTGKEYDHLFKEVHIFGIHANVWVEGIEC